MKRKSDKQVENELVSMYRGRAEFYGVTFHPKKVRAEVRRQLKELRGTRK